jgi:hypothetical protein
MAAASWGRSWDGGIGTATPFMHAPFSSLTVLIINSMVRAPDQGCNGLGGFCGNPVRRMLRPAGANVTILTKQRGSMEIDYFYPADTKF